MQQHRWQSITSDVVPTDRRADRIVQALTGASRRQTQGLFDQGCVRLNGVPCHEPWRWLDVGDRLDVEYDDQQRYAAHKRPPQYLGFTILYEDAAIVVVDKPAAWLTVPSPKRESNTLVQRVSAYLTRRNRGRQVRVWAVQRLDRGVSGVIVLARDEAAAAALRQEFAAHKPARSYIALVAGRLAERRGTFRSYLTAGDDLRQRSGDDPSSGQLAITHWEVERLGDDATQVRVRLETGRRNQIRVHFATAGHPVLGDTHYGGPAAQHPRWTASRLALHATELGFSHPLTGAPLHFTVPCPEEFTEFAASVRLLDLPATASRAADHP
ncbi:MAG: RluA family pseudouridine synthase [Pirellulales bacterium]